MKTSTSIIHLDSCSGNNFYKFTGVFKKEFQESIQKFSKHFQLKDWIVDHQNKTVKIRIELYTKKLPVKFLQSTVISFLK